MGSCGVQISKHGVKSLSHVFMWSTHGFMWGTHFKTWGKKFFPCCYVEPTWVHVGFTHYKIGSHGFSHSFMGCTCEHVGVNMGSHKVICG